MAAFVAVCALAGVPALAHADDREVLQAKGEQQAKDGRYQDAIESFKAADRIQPRAIHACLISLAYTRRELWPQAELFLSICHQRAKAGDPLPDWVTLADQQIKDRLVAAGVVEVTIEAKPPNANVTVSSFAPDEVFEPRTIHLPLGRHVVFARAPGYVDGQTTLELTDRTPKHIVIELAPVAGSAQPGEPLQNKATVFEPAHPTPPPPGKRGTPLLIAGGAALVLGIGAHAFMGYEHGFLQEAHDTGPSLDQQWKDHATPYDVARISTVVLYATAATCIGIGLYQRSHSPQTPYVATIPLPEGGAIVSVGWQR